MSLVLLTAAVASAGCHFVPYRTPTAAGPAPIAATGSGRIPRDAARFEIEAVDDSTARFRPFEATWLKPGMQVYAVDPARRDALVARLRIVRSDSGRLVALVTAQVTRVTTDHFLLAVEPSVPWYRTGRFWWGVVGGGVTGAAGAIVAR
jgi:hypothetical protein